MRRFYSILGILSLQAAALVACDRGMQADTAAMAGDFTLSVDDAAQLLAPVSSLPNEAGVVETTLDFWIDYTLLAQVVHDPGAIDQLDIAPLLDLERSHQLVLRLRDRVIQVDTTVTDEELAQIFEDEHPGEEVRARHILLSVPSGSTQEQQDSIRARAESLRDRARAGEDFATLARENSEDPGSAVQGGDLGFFGRGQMVAPFEEAAFALEPGEVSDVVQSQFGFHIIKLEDRRRPTLEDFGPEYRSQLQQQRTMVAESTYLAGLEGPANVQVVDGAMQIAREIASDPEADLSRAEASAPLTTFSGGTLTAGQFRDFLLSQAPEVWQQISSAPDDQLDQMFHQMTRDQLLLAEAVEQGIALAPEEEADIASQIREQYTLIADFLKLDSIQAQEGETMHDAIEREVGGLMSRLVSNEQDIIPLGPLARPLRSHYGVREADDATDRIVARIDELRAGGPQGASPAEPAPAPDAAPPDSAGQEP
jgi:hypothetical protein